jgi:formate dehydrogenase subunit gamma
MPFIRSTIIALGLLLVVAGIAVPANAQQSSPTVPVGGPVSEQQLLHQNSQIKGLISIPDEKAAVLMQPRGREWRAYHENILPWIASIFIFGMLALLAAFLLWRGRLRITSGFAGIKILRFNSFERFMHWLTATCFVILAITGLNIAFGKTLLLPLIGNQAFTSASQWGKYAHDFLAWPFMFGIALMLIVWIKDNVPNRIDWNWLKAGGGFFDDQHPPAERFNAGQKLIFWTVVIGGVLLSISGLFLLFPFAAFGIAGMQVVQVVHGFIAVVMIAIILAHIYIGTIGMEGAFEAMGTGEVDLAWAKEHHALWVAEEQAKEGQRASPAQAPAAAE